MKRTSIGLVVLVLFGIGGCRSIPGPRLPPLADRETAWVQDLTYLRDEFPRFNQSFDDASLVEFTQIVQETLESVETNDRLLCFRSGVG